MGWLDRRGHPPFRGGRDCQYETPFADIVYSVPGTPWPTPEDTAAGIFEEESDCDAASIGAPVSVPGAAQAMVYCRAAGLSGILAMTEDGQIVLSFATDDPTAIAVAEMAIETL